MPWEDKDVSDLERVLIRARAEAVSRRNDASRMHVAYSDKRDVFTINHSGAVREIETIDRLLMLAKTLRVNDG